MSFVCVHRKGRGGRYRSEGVPIPQGQEWMLAKDPSLVEEVKLPEGNVEAEVIAADAGKSGSDAPAEKLTNKGCQEEEEE